MDRRGVQESSLVTEQQSMGRTLRSLIRRAPVSCPPDTPIVDALRAMQREGTGSIVIVAPEAPRSAFSRGTTFSTASRSRAANSMSRSPPS